MIIPLSFEIQEALLGRRNDLYQVLSWALQIEHYDLNLKGMDLQKEDINKIYLHAINWAKMLMKETDESA